MYRTHRRWRGVHDYFLGRVRRNGGAWFVGLGVHMKITKESVAEYATEHGLTPVQVDGIPEGFSWIEPDLTIGKELIVGRHVGFLPLRDWNEYHKVTAENAAELLTRYKLFHHGK